MQALALAMLLAAAPRTVAVLDLGARGGVPKDLAQTLSEVLTIEVRRAAREQRVYGAEDIKALIGFKRQTSLLGCEDTACLAELGGALGAQELVTGSLSQIADDYVLVARRLDVSRARVLSETTLNVPVGNARRLEDAVRLAVAQLYGIAAPPVAPEGSRRSRAWSWVMMGGAVAAAAAGGWGFVQYANFAGLRSQSASPATAPTYSQAQAAASSAQVGLPVGIAAAIVTAGLAVGAALAW